MAKIFDKVFHIVFFVIFSIVTIISIKSILGKSIAAVVLGTFFIVAAVWGFSKLRKKFSDITDKKLTITFIIMIAVMFIFQLIAGLTLAATPTSDWEIIDKIAKSYAYNGNMEHIYDDLPKFNNYLARYPNNNGIAILFSLYYRAIYLMTGTTPIQAAIVLNTIFINAAVIFCFLTTKKAFGKFHALIVAIICFLFLPYYTYCPYYYTDSVSMPFCILSIYLFICAYDSKKTVPKIILFFFSGVTCAIGYALKGSIVIVLVAAVVYMIYKGGIKKMLLGSGTIIAGFLAFTIAFSGIVSAFNIADKETSDKEKYPITHWIMMGLNGKGGYNREDSKITAHAGDYNEKKEVNIEVIKQRLSDYGFFGLMGHLGEKIEFTWDDGTYYISHYVYKFLDEDNCLHNIIPKPAANHPDFYIFSSAMHILILAMVCVSLFLCIRKPRFDYITFVHIIMFGVFLFFLIWETRSRYIYNFTPVFIIICADGILRIIDRVEKPITLGERLKNNIQGKKAKAAS